MEVVQRAWIEWLAFKVEQSQTHKKEIRIPRVKKMEPWKKSERGGVNFNIRSICEGKGKGAGLEVVAKR